jgi:phosphomevalonate kinase
MYKVKVPGKLYFLGEYNVLADGHSAILFAIDRYIKVSISESNAFILVNEQEIHPLTFNLGKVKVEDDSLKITEAALQVALDYLKYKEIELKPFRIHLTNELVSEDGLKYGFGSSAAILIAILRAVFLFHNVHLSNWKIFKIAVLGQLFLGKKTSGGDLACCTFGGLVYYKRYSDLWLEENLHRGFEIVDEKWPFLMITNLPTHKLDLVIGWTNSPHSTDAAIGRVMNKESEFHAFADKAEPLVLEARQAIEDNDLARLSPIVNRYQALLYKLDFDLDLGFNSPILNELIKTTNELGGAGKISGAGYGDCGIALIENKKKLEQAWEEKGIRVIKCEIAPQYKEKA